MREDRIEMYDSYRNIPGAIEKSQELSGGGAIYEDAKDEAQNKIGAEE